MYKNIKIMHQFCTKCINVWGRGLMKDFALLKHSFCCKEKEKKKGTNSTS